MKVGMLLHQDLGVDAVLDEARMADQQGFDSVWLFDHLMDFRGHQGPDGPMDSFVLMTAALEPSGPRKGFLRGQVRALLPSGNPETLGRVLGEPDWPTRPMTLVRNASIFASETESIAVQQATRAFSDGAARGTLEDFLRNNVVGTPERCLARLREFEAWGVNYVRAAFGSAEQPADAARLVLPLLSTGEVRV
jgi:alkanesulfonate monooxygenase SsuD/methylene tetrahydromethanopterin reductase-like flavin-dependent oxidoreductase (luciferase family)